MTHAGQVVGTPSFMSPEQCQSEPVDARADIYALGATYYALLTGRGPYAESTTMPMVMFAHCYRPVPDPREVLPGIPEACAAIVRRAMAKDPSCRYQTAEEMLADLEAVLSGSEGRAEGGPESIPAERLRGGRPRPDSQRPRAEARRIASPRGAGRVARAGPSIALSESDSPEKDRDWRLRESRALYDRPALGLPRTGRLRSPRPALADPISTGPRREDASGPPRSPGLNQGEDSHEP